VVAYSFKRRFVLPIRVGLGGDDNADHSVIPKRQTIRARGRRRHARPGEELQLYCGLRARGAFLIGRARCKEVRDIVLTLDPKGCVAICQRVAVYRGDGLDEFARTDGFDSWASLLQFWKEEHGDLAAFVGLLIEWEPLT
jgi:hypothetical protein